MRADSVGRHAKLGGYLRGLEVARQVANDPQLGIAEALPKRGGFADAAGGATSEDAEDGSQKRGMCGSVARQSLKQILYGNEEERQDDSLGLGELERAF